MQDIVPAIRREECRKVIYPGFEVTYYYVDPIGNIYSLRDAQKPKALDQKQGDGLWWVTMYNAEGTIKRIMVGDLVAHTYLGNVDHETDETTVTYKDSDPSNNAADNLQWDTPARQGAQIRKIQSMVDPLMSAGGQEAINDIELPEDWKTCAEIPLEGVPVQSTHEKDPIVSQLHETQALLEVSLQRSRIFATALEPFGKFMLSPGDGAELGGKVVLEANKGTGNHSMLTVHDFREAKKALTGEDTTK